MSKAPLPIAPCPKSLPAELHESIERFARLWQSSPLRPRVTSACLAQWQTLIGEWITSTDLPVLIRAGVGRRGQELFHANGRIVICTDNSPAHWSLALALQGRCPIIEDVRKAFRDDAVPVCMALAREERVKAKYRCNRQALNLNELGWKVCHRVGVGEGIPSANGRS
jgi:hypothetical protein